MIKWYYLSNRKYTVAVKVRNGWIIDSPPIVRKFRGQTINNLINWMRRFKGFTIIDIT